MDTPPPTENGYFFADHLILDDSATRNYFRTLIQGLIHKNNNMLGVIQGFSSLVLMEDDLDSGVRENVEQMRDSSVKAAELAEVILAAAGSARVATEPVDLNDRLPHYQQSAQRIADSAGVTLSFTAGEGLPKVLCDASKIGELPPELIKNAAEASSGADDQVSVSFTPSANGGIDLLVQNLGPDIAAETLPQIFDPFFTTKDGSHYGLGLTAAGVLAGQMNARLGVQSTGGTTRVWLHLPPA